MAHDSISNRLFLSAKASLHARREAGANEARAERAAGALEPTCGE